MPSHLASGLTNVVAGQDENDAIKVGAISALAGKFVAPYTYM